MSTQAPNVNSTKPQHGLEHFVAYLARHRGSRWTVLCIGLCVASVALFIGVALYFFPDGGVHYTLWDWLFPVLFLLAALALDFVVTWIRRSSSSQGFWKLFARTSAIIFAGAVLTSVAVMREHWFQIMNELIHRILRR